VREREQEKKKKKKERERERGKRERGETERERGSCERQVKAYYSEEKTAIIPPRGTIGLYWPSKQQLRRNNSSQHFYWTVNSHFRAFAPHSLSWYRGGPKHILYYLVIFSQASGRWRRHRFKCP
jgi:hypothetical protein